MDSSHNADPPRLEIDAHDDFGMIYAGDALDADFLARDCGGRRFIRH
jgi:hypothetical protein